MSFQPIQTVYDRRFEGRPIGSLFCEDYGSRPPTSGGKVLGNLVLQPGFGVYLTNNNEWTLPTLDTDSYLVTHILGYQIQDNSVAYVAANTNQTRQIVYNSTNTNGLIFGYREGVVIVNVVGTVEVGDRVAYNPTLEAFDLVTNLPAQTGDYKTAFEVAYIGRANGVGVAAVRARQI